MEFRSDAAVMERENRQTALAALVLVPLFLRWLRGERDLLVLAIFGAGAALLTYLFYRWRDARSRVEVLRLDDAGIDATGPRVRLRHAWPEIARARRSSYGGAHWALRTPAGWRVLRLEGFTSEQLEQIDAIVRERTGAPHPAEEPVAR